MKKLVSFVLAIVTVMSMTCTAFAAKIGPGLYGENIEWYWDENTKTLSILGSDKMLNYSDPSRREWNSLEDQVEHLIIGDEVTYIGSYSFYDMDNLKDVVMGSAVTKIDNYAFKSCEKLTGKLDLKNVNYVGEEAFIYSNFTEINFGKVTTVEKNAFGYNNTIKSLSVPAGITFGRTVFNQCKNLETLYIDSNVSNAMFNECSKLTTVTIGDHVTAIGEYAFYLTGIVNINVGKNVKTIGDWAFTNTVFKDIVVNADTIGYAAFGGENTTNIVFVECDAVNINVDAIAEKHAHFVYLKGANGWDTMEKSACWDGTKIQNVNLDISNGDIYCYKLDDGSYGYVNGRTFYRSDSNNITIGQSTATTSNKIYVVNGNFDITLNNINIVKVYDGWGIIRLLNGSSANFIIPEGTHSIVNNDGDTNDGWYASGIWAEENTNVTISGTGKLDLYGSSNRSGLFSDGNVTINNVTLYSKGGPVASGIHVKKQLTINNSNVTAVGGPLGAGIRVNSNSTLVVNSGNVHATTGIDGAGIGGEGQGGNCGTIIINSGNVYARGGDFYGITRGADIGVGGNGTTAKYLYISKNATVDAQYIGNYFNKNAEDIFSKIEVEDASVIKNLISTVPVKVVETPTEPEVPTTPTEPETPVVPETPVTPAEPETPVTPTEPETPTVPAEPETPVTPSEPVVPETPVTPTEPETPSTPTVDDDPIVEDIPEEPEDPEFTIGGRVYTIKVESSETVTAAKRGKTTKTINITIKLHRNNAKKACTIVFATYDANGRYLGMKSATVKAGSSKDISVKCAIDNSKSKIATVKMMSISIDGKTAGSLFSPLGPAATVYVK